MANVTGSSSLEAVLRFKPVLMFGYEWSQNCPGVFRVSSPGDCRRAFEQIKNGAIHTEEQLINYFTLVGRCTFQGYVDPACQVDSFLSNKENTENLSQALLRELK